MQSILNFLNDFSHTLTTIITIVVSIYTIGKYCIVKPIQRIVTDENKSIRTEIEEIKEQLTTNDGSSLRDAVNRIERDVKRLKNQRYRRGRNNRD